MKTFTVTDADAEKLAELLRENAEYRPDYFDSLAQAVLGQMVCNDKQGGVYTMNWTTGERLALAGIIAEWIGNSENLAHIDEWAQLIVFLSSKSKRFLENNIGKFAAAIDEYRENGGDQ